MKRSLEKEFEKLIVKIKGYNADELDVKFLKKVWKFSKLAHSGQKRLSGDPYVLHELETAKNLANWKLDIKTIAAGLLHDVVEDGAATNEDIIDNFGEEVTGLVSGVTKVSNVKLRGKKEEEFVENLRKMFLAMAKDLRVVLVKLADRLHNMQTLSYVAEEKQERIAKETLEVFAPLVERLGMGEVKAELDDLAFPYVYPAEYEKVKEKSQVHYKKADLRIKKMKRTLLKKLSDQAIKAKIDTRKKHLYSLWKKLERPGVNWNFERIYDIGALRILVDTVSQCYAALGIVHQCYKLVPHIGVSDFIAQPKPNGYQSIHTIVFSPGQKIIEVQIRTYTMHEQAEFGMAAHWAYSQAKSKGVKDELLARGISVDKDKLAWVKQLTEWQKVITDSEEFLKAVKFDTLSRRIFVFSPKGDVYDLPSGATPIDFAYAVHTGLGKYVKSAKVNEKISPLSKKLESGDVVEVIKGKSPKKPSSRWLDFVVTLQAKHSIAKQLRRLDS
ncbi:hypothetical protein A2686_02220 [Candidatus Woesebacteria bacterium RIFCSPHIGHO2_01_FULL_38_10]|uniref:TGS domain-containing protein n=1 Tax=Candidatus Woesebacteria bacterium RIFCSPLOWO2_01_FULL_39_10b TaxID=1802517 RepID=A0A1F8B9T3_9BACT|nr:MAG: hypothetical protein A2686_02220 [Candidatus Woesebacteria bacterium RIFCSPHIGHO2_01_FULL_38_10]OGM60793.1 MAG: hypothetical protein A2892_01990 [Candidatus Woesebacteria bacterium RIFCSPLOWO2_01_FULL_39_10b]